jgi:hypothetical protein
MISESWRPMDSEIKQMCQQKITTVMHCWRLAASHRGALRQHAHSGDRAEHVQAAAKRKNAPTSWRRSCAPSACAGARDADASQRTKRSSLTTSRSPPAPSQIQELASLGFVAHIENFASANGRLDNAGRLTRMPNCPGIWGSFIFRISPVRWAKRKPD